MATVAQTTFLMTDHPSFTGSPSKFGRTAGASPCDTPVQMSPTKADRGQRPVSIQSSDGSESYFNPYGPSRPTSMYSLSRASFANQISQLTSSHLPHANSLSYTIASTPTSTAAAKALTEAAGQIRRWIVKASAVLDGLHAEDDVEWAAAAGREGLDEVDNAINRFETLIRVYVTAIEDVRRYQDISDLPVSLLSNVIGQMDDILDKWQCIKATLKGVKEQVEIAMEWEELWNSVIGEIGVELDLLRRLVFEMEEKRHKCPFEEDLTDMSRGLDIERLETIVEEKQKPESDGRAVVNDCFSLFAGFPRSLTDHSRSPSGHEESTLLALFARMQPLRASLDFLPMRLSVFVNRAEKTFPTACDELRARHFLLENRWKRLETDAEALRRELSDDRWVLMFRNAGRSASKMLDSIERSLRKLREALDVGAQRTNMPDIAKRIESYEAKKTHYGPAIERVLAIIDTGLKDRLSVNGEILRLQRDVRKRWESTRVEMNHMSVYLERSDTTQSEQLRDSVSTVVSIDRSFTSSVVDTPGSSPASSVVTSERKRGGHDTFTPLAENRPSLGPRFNTTYSNFTPNRSGSMIHGSPTLPTTPSLFRRPEPLNFHGTSSNDTKEESLSPASRTTVLSPTMPPHCSNRDSLSAAHIRPRWNGSTNVDENPNRPTPHGTPSGQRRPPSVASRRSFGIPVSSPLRESIPFSPSSTITPVTNKRAFTVPSNLNRAATPATCRRSSAVPVLHPTVGLTTPSVYPETSVKTRAISATGPLPTTRRVSGLPSANRPGTSMAFTPASRGRSPSRAAELEKSPLAGRSRGGSTRPASVMGGRRSSMLPVPTFRREKVDA